MMCNLHSKENRDKHSEPREDLKGEKKISLNFEELKDWGPKNVMKLSTPAVNKTPRSGATLPLRCGRALGGGSSAGAMANLPLRCGKNVEESISRHVSYLPQRFGRTTAESVTTTLSDVLNNLSIRHLSVSCFAP
ncbi:pro-FMRFamide-related neuropeptide VF [Pteronotus mesoamericanus]|uniref:pro-FMRFamide-related neuropeptide VF n=1 Tax=Pteronotus mesoamericanus TaxID=1884717 RepID=UPI0023EC81FA|nr:pro-FMRFamide-related neuropeptide VF [Pteronotus parnellii mesoamericanus]